MKVCLNADIGCSYQQLMYGITYGNLHYQQNGITDGYVTTAYDKPDVMSENESGDESFERRQLDSAELERVELEGNCLCLPDCSSEQ